MPKFDVIDPGWSYSHRYVVKELLRPDALIEIDAIAVLENTH